MIKTVALIRRKPGISKEEFVRYYEHEHAPLVLKTMPQIRRYVRNHTVLVDEGSPETTPAYDCVTEIYFDDMESSLAAHEVMTSSAGDVIREDETNFLDQASMVHFLVDVYESGPN